MCDAQDAQRNQQRQRSFGAVCGGAERVEAEDRDAGDRADALGAFFRGRQRLAHQKVEPQHAYDSLSWARAV